MAGQRCSPGINATNPHPENTRPRRQLVLPTKLSDTSNTAEPAIASHKEAIARARAQQLAKEKAGADSHARRHDNDATPYQAAPSNPPTTCTDGGSAEACNPADAAQPGPSHAPEATPPPATSTHVTSIRKRVTTESFSDMSTSSIDSGDGIDKIYSDTQFKKPGKLRPHKKKGE